MRSAHFYIDGFSLKRISDYYKYEHTRHSRLCIKALECYLRYELAHRFGFASDSENLAIEKRFYYPCENPRVWKKQNKNCENLLKFEARLKESGYFIHYASNPLFAESQPNGNLFTEAIFTSQKTNIDIFILLTTQGQFASVLQQFKHRSIPTMLIGWQGFCKNSKGRNMFWQTDKTLIAYATSYCPLEKVLNSPDGSHPLAEIMFEKFFKFAVRQRHPIALCAPTQNQPAT